MIGPLGRQGPAATLGQHCPQVTRRPGNRGDCKKTENADRQGGGGKKFLKFNRRVRRHLFMTYGPLHVIVKYERA